jgi:hypothetical protein
MKQFRDRCPVFSVRVTRDRDDTSDQRRVPVHRVLDIFDQKADLRFKLKVIFEGEPAIDAGGPTAALFHGFFEQLMAGQGREGDGRPPLFTKDDPGDDRIQFMLPVAFASETQKRQLICVGRVLAKMLHEGCQASALAALPDFFFRYLWDRVVGARDARSVELTTREYEQFVGRKMSAQLYKVVFAKDDALGDIYGLSSQEVQEGGFQYVRGKRSKIVASRLAGLEAVVQGFQDPTLVAGHFVKVLQIGGCTWRELRALVAGTSVDRNRKKLLRLLKFRDFPPQWQHQQEWVREAVQNKLSEPELKSFLLFITEDDAIPVVPARDFLTIRFISVQPDRLPTAHTCSNTLDLPPYSSKATFLRCLRTAVRDGRGQGYGMV